MTNTIKIFVETFLIGSSSDFYSFYAQSPIIFGILLARGRFFKKWEKWIFFGNDSLDYRPKSALVILLTQRQSAQDVLRISLEILFW